MGGEIRSVLQPNMKTQPTEPSNPEFKAAVGMSRKWDAREAGREVAINTLNQLNGKKPDFFLLFATIHYEKHGGFQEFLNGVWEILPPNTPLIGGTVAGFMNPQGCYTRGTSALAVSYPNLEVTMGIGKNTKRTPHLAAKNCGEMIKKKLNESKYKNKFVYELISGSVVVDAPTIGKRRVFKGKLFDFMGKFLSYDFLSFFQKGTGREEDVIQTLSNVLGDYYLIGGSTIDDNNMLNNFQFYDKKVHTNSIVALGIAIDTSIFLNTTYGLIDSKTKINVTKIGKNKKTIVEVNDRPALEGYLSALGMDKDFIDERLHRRTFFTPLGYAKDGILFPNVVGLIFGNSLIVGYKILSNDLTLFSASGRSLVGAIDENLDALSDKKILLSFIVSCSARLEALGCKIFFIREKLKDFYGDIPFLLIYAGGEDTYSSATGVRHVNESFNTLSLVIET